MNNIMVSESHAKRLKFAVIFARYAISGVPLAQIRLAQALVRRGHDVDLIVGYVPEKLVLPRLDGVNIIYLDIPRVRNMIYPIFNYLRKQKPDVVFTAEDHQNAIVLLAKLLSNSSSRISASSRVTPFDTYSNRIFTKRWFLKQIMRLLIARADVLTCVSEGMVNQYKLLFKKNLHRCVYNIIYNSTNLDKMREPLNHPFFKDSECSVIVAAGQLGPWKGFLDLIEAMAILRKRRSARLVILGDGPQRDELSRRIDNLGLADAVLLEGFVENPLKYFFNADVFVLSSLVEGMPNVLIEAMMCGCTPVSTNCPTGPSEVLKDGKYGYLVPMRDPEAMAGAIEEALERPISKSLLREAILPFEESRVLDRHFQLLGLQD